MMNKNEYERWKQEQALNRYKERQKLKDLIKKYKPKKRTSIDTVSGGLPSLGKRR